MKKIFASLRKLFQDSPRRAAATTLYAAIVDQSREAAFFGALGVPDTLDGRFDMIVMHTFLVISRLNQEGQDGKDLAQAVFDLMIEDMDRGLRLLGSADVRLGKRIKAMAQAYYGRARAYEEALADVGGALAEAVHRNLFRGAEGHEERAKLVASYLRREAEDLGRLEAGGLLAGRIGFGAPPPALEEDAASDKD